MRNMEEVLFSVDDAGRHAIEVDHDNEAEAILSENILRYL